MAHFAAPDLVPRRRQYFPLGGGRKGKARTCINVLIVFALSGLWHGAAMKYVLWGLLFGVFQVIGGLLTPAKQRLCAALRIPWDAGWLPVDFRVIITFGLSTFAWTSLPRGFPLCRRVLLSNAL